MWKIKPELHKLNYKNPLHLMAVGFGSGLSPGRDRERFITNIKS